MCASVAVFSFGFQAWQARVPESEKPVESLRGIAQCNAE
jgi:hypothetical protein